MQSNNHINSEVIQKIVSFLKNYKILRNITQGHKLVEEITGLIKQYSYMKLCLPIGLRVRRGEAAVGPTGDF